MACGSMNRLRWIDLSVVGMLAVLAAWHAPAAATAAPEHGLLTIMKGELDLSMEKLVSQEGTQPYFLQYAVTDAQSVRVAATLGSIISRRVDHSRGLDVDIRCGDYALDNTHQIRGGYYGRFNSRGGSTELPLNGDPVAMRHAMWLSTDAAFKGAVKRLAEVKANVKVKVEEEDLSDDFSKETPRVSIDPWLAQSVDVDRLVERVRMFSRRFRRHPLIYNSTVSFNGTTNNYLVINSEGGKLQHGRGHWRISIQASTVAEDGMQLSQYHSFDAASPEGLPEDAEILAAVDKVIEQVLALREAPVVDPYTGPAILVNRASGVFFHEIFGHRIEGHRQKDVDEGQTFAKKIGHEVLPTFISIVDDPSQKRFGDVDLNGHYVFDDECVRAQPARVVEDGVLKTFLLSRSPTRGFTKSNGHGRRQPGNTVVARQGNLIIESTKQVPFAKLREMLVEECKKQEKPYGLLFEDISGGFTNTQRRGPQAFKVLPIMVYRVYPDGRPDELVRGVDIVGTPLTCFTKIICTGDDPGVFNGQCGAESGWVPVSAISPSILVTQIEIEKQRKAQERPPILEAPIGDETTIAKP